MKYFYILLLLINPIFGLAQTSEDMKDTSKISQKEFEKIIKDAKTLLLTDLCDADFNVYLAGNGKLILKDIFDTGAIIYSSKEEYLKVLKDFEDSSGGKIVEHVLFPFQEKILEIPNNDTNIIKNYLMTLECDYTDYNVIDKEKYIDKVVTKISEGRNDDDYLENNIIPLTTIIGVYIKHKINGKWVFKKSSSNPDVREIFIESSDGTLYNPWLDIYKVLYERKKVDIGSIVRVLLNN